LEGNQNDWIVRAVTQHVTAMPSVKKRTGPSTRKHAR
jgi:hypothetical protein